MASSSLPSPSMASSSLPDLSSEAEEPIDLLGVYYKDADALLSILERLSGKQLSVCAAVCKEMCSVVHDDALWLPLAAALPSKWAYTKRERENEEDKARMVALLNERAQKTQPVPLGRGRCRRIEPPDHAGTGLGWRGFRVNALEDLAPLLFQFRCW